MSSTLVSVIIRTKNEERWIGSCLRGVRRQSYPRVEVVLVDNGSTDQTVAKAEPMVDRVVTIDEFLPGKAINDGIRASNGEIVVCLSGHCIPTGDRWLERLVADLADPEVGGVYGRQEPLSYSSALDKRDLMITFGLDRRVQRRDSFFHNANSAIRRDVWDRFPFDEQVTNIEDRLWARTVLENGFILVYEPEASVYHHHGIHHAGDLRRAEQIVKIMEGIDGLITPSPGKHVDDLRIVALIPSRGRSLHVGGHDLSELVIRDAVAAQHVDAVVVATDDDTTADLARAAGATVASRPAELSEEYVGVGEVLQFALDSVEEALGPPDLVVVLEETNPFRPSGLLDAMIERLVEEGLDSVIAVKAESRRILERKDGIVEPLGSQASLPRRLRDSETFLGLFGLGCVTHPEFVRDGSLLGKRVGIYEVDAPVAAVEVRTAADAEAIAPLLDAWLEGGGR